MEGYWEYLRGQLWEELLLFLFLWGPLLWLAALCVMTLNNLPPQRRRGLFALFFTLLGVAAALFGGAWALGRHGLTWRTWFRQGLSAVLWLVGLAAGFLTVCYGGRWLAEKGAVVKNAAMGLSVLCFASAMLVGTLAGGLWALGPSEQVVTYAGQRAVLGKWGWGSGYELYEYRGPLVRGAGPMLVDWDETLVEGAVNW